MARNITGDVTADSGVADMDGIPRIEMRGECGEVGGVVIPIVSVAGLAGPPVTVPVMRDEPGRPGSGRTS